MSLFFSKYTHKLAKHIDPTPLPIIWDAGIYRRDFAEGRPLPLLIIDTSKRPDVAHLIALQQHFDAGDVIFMWVQLEGRSNHWSLLVQAQKPLRCDFIIDFNIDKQGVLVETAMQSRGLYLQAGKPGEDFLGTIDKPKMMVELPDVGAKPYWDKAFYSVLYRKYRAMGSSRKDANIKARLKISFARSMASGRVPQSARPTSVPDEN